MTGARLIRRLRVKLSVFISSFVVCPWEWNHDCGSLCR